MMQDLNRHARLCHQIIMSTRQGACQVNHATPTPAGPFRSHLCAPFGSEAANYRAARIAHPAECSDRARPSLCSSGNSGAELTGRGWRQPAPGKGRANKLKRVHSESSGCRGAQLPPGGWRLQRGIRLQSGPPASLQLLEQLGGGALVYAVPVICAGQHREQLVGSAGMLPTLLNAGHAGRQRSCRQPQPCATAAHRMLGPCSAPLHSHSAAKREATSTCKRRAEAGRADRSSRLPHDNGKHTDLLDPLSACLHNSKAAHNVHRQKWTGSGLREAAGFTPAAAAEGRPPTLALSRPRQL